MTIYRGVGGGGDATTDAGLSQLTLLEQSASDSATAAASSAAVAQASESVVSASAAAAANSQASAAADAALVSSLYDSFDDRYLGVKSSAPTVDNDGNSLLTGALYWNSVSNVMQVWNGTAWVSFNPVNNPVDQSDIGTAPNEVPLNQYLGNMAYQDAESVVLRPSASVDPNGIGDVVFEWTNDTTITVKLKGSDNVVRTGTITLA